MVKTLSYRAIRHQRFFVMKPLIDIGDPNAPEGSQPWCRSFHLSLCRLKRDGQFAVSNLKYSLRQFHDSRYFDRLADADGKLFTAWEDFVQYREPFGLDMRVDVAKAIMDEQDDARLLKDVIAERAAHAQAIDATAPDLRQHGANQHGRGVGNHENVTKSSLNDASYAMARLRRDRPDLHARVLAGELSAHAGMVEAGFRKRRGGARKKRRCRHCGREL
jgi:hypothetical protein